MQEEEKRESESETHRVRLPGFLLDEDRGLGDVVKSVTQAFGIQPCGGCERRRQALNQWLTFTSGNNG